MGVYTVVCVRLWCAVCVSYGVCVYGGCDVGCMNGLCDSPLVLTSLCAVVYAYCVCMCVTKWVIRICGGGGLFCFVV